MSSADGLEVSEPTKVDPNCPSCAILREELAELREMIKAQAGVIAKLGAEVDRLKARKPKTSRTSSKPPSSDGPWSKRVPSRKPKSGKKRGGQPGHEGKTREAAEPKDVDEVKMVLPANCGSCNATLTGEDSNPRIHQIMDIPVADPVIVEFRLHELRCGGCGKTTKAGLPEGVHQSSFGPNITALVTLLSGKYRMSRRSIQRYIADFHGAIMSLGSISNIEGRMTHGLAAPHAEAMASVAASATKHLDETSWRECNQLAWLWAGVGEDATAFIIRPSRGNDVAREMIGDRPTGFIITDRFVAYSFISIDQRQVCLAHLLRDFQRMAEGQKDLRWIGQRLLGLTHALFHLWHMHRRGEIERVALRRWSRHIRARIWTLLDVGARSCGYETPSMCRGILKTEPAMYTFIEHEGVEPTNNIAERAVRPVVIHRKTSLGSQSNRGSRFIERMHTVSATLKMTGRSVSGFVIDVAHTVLAGAPAPKLLA